MNEGISILTLLSVTFLSGNRWVKFPKVASFISKK